VRDTASSGPSRPQRPEDYEGLYWTPSARASPAPPAPRTPSLPQLSPLEFRRHSSSSGSERQGSDGTGNNSNGNRSNGDSSNGNNSSNGGSHTTNGADSQEEVDNALLSLLKEGGVKIHSILLAQADAGVKPNIREWTYTDIQRLPLSQRQEWLLACRQELDSLRARSVYELVSPPPGRKVIKNRWVFDVKTDGRKRARLVAKGFSQVEGIDYDEIFSPVVRYETVRLILALAAIQRWQMSSVDVKTAFLYGELDEELYMEQPQGFKVKNHEHKVLRLKRAIYGLKQAALQWWKALDKSMIEIGFRRLKSDAGIFVQDGRNGPKVIVIVYVDDAVFLGPADQDVRHAKAQFMRKWECRDIGPTKEFLRMRLHVHKDFIALEQKDYLVKVLERFGMQNAKSAMTPLPSGYVPTPNDGPIDEKLRNRYQQLIGSLLYLMLGTRPDIAFAVTKMSQFAANPTQEHFDKALYICRYLVGTADYDLQYKRSGNGLIAYADADWGSDTNTRRSISGNLVMLADGAISWTSKAQKTIALSSTEAEYMSISDASRQLVWIHSLLGELKIPIKSIPLCGDNQGSIFTAANPVTEKRTKHIDIRYHFIREVIDSGIVTLHFVETNNNSADMLTKNLVRDKFLTCRKTLGLRFFSTK